MTTVHSRKEFLQFISTLLPKESIGIEIGVLYGDFSQMILDEIKPLRLYLIDPYGLESDKQQKNYGGDPHSGQLDTAYSQETDYENVKIKFAKQISTGNVIVKRAYSHDVADYFEDESLNFVYVDGCHLYSCVKSDLEYYFPKMRKDGIIAGHDYNMEGVKKAVDEFAAQNNFRFIAINDTEFDFALQR